eukprot:8197-Heterococcus_DN1.PRE.1
MVDTFAACYVRAVTVERACRLTCTVTALPAPVQSLLVARKVAAAAAAVVPATRDLSPPAPITRQKPLTRAEKDVILQETIARQQKLMAKAQGIDLDNDDPAASATAATASATASGGGGAHRTRGDRRAPFRLSIAVFVISTRRTATVVSFTVKKIRVMPVHGSMQLSRSSSSSANARLRAIARAQGEARANTVLPSTAAADNYLDSLKQQTRKTREQQEEELRAAREAAQALPNPYAHAKPGHYSTAADDYLDALSGRSNPARDSSIYSRSVLGVVLHICHIAYMHRKLRCTSHIAYMHHITSLVVTLGAAVLALLLQLSLQLVLAAYNVCAHCFSCLTARAVLNATAIDTTLTADLFMCTATSRSMQRRIDDQQQTPRDFAQQQQAAFDQLDQRQQPASRSSSAFSSGSTEYTDGLKSAVRFDPTAANPEMSCWPSSALPVLRTMLTDAG